MMTKLVDIIIPVHNTLHLTMKCIPALSIMIEEANKKHNTEYSITVIDDGSDDGTEQWLSHNYPEVNILKGDGNLWWSGAVTMAAKNAFEDNNKDYVLLWNNDIIPEKNYFSILSDILQKTNKIVIIGSKICELDNPNKIWSVGGIFNPKTGAKYMLGHDKQINTNNKALIKPDWLTGMGTVVPKETTEKIGYWNYKDFPLYHGDADFTYRAKKAGVTLIVYPELVLYNDTSNTGFMHDGKLSTLLTSLTATRSKYNLKKEWKFYRIHAASPIANLQLLNKYFRYTGGFIKWKILKLFGRKKTNQ
ncbi:MAG: glycosyltransferase family 2 protein [Bacteroidales bacterium]